MRHCASFLNLGGVFRSPGFVLGPILDAKKIAQATAKAVEERLTPQYKLDLDAVGGDEAEIAKVFERHYTNFGGAYFVDCGLALKANHPLPPPPDR